MMRLRFWSRLAALAALAGMLFLQTALAFAVCDLPSGARVSMTAAMMQPATPECHEADQNMAFCVGHCQAEDRMFGKAQASLPDLSAPLVMQPVLWAQPVRVEHGFAPVPVIGSGPPPRILFQSLLL